MIRPASTLTLAALVAIVGCVADSSAPTDAPSATRGTFRIHGENLDLDYEMINGDMVFGGDMILDPDSRVSPTELESGIHTDSFKTGTSLAADRWPHANIYYTIDSSVSSAHKTNVALAMDEWEAKTPIRFVKRTTQAAYTTFTEPVGQAVCAASVVGYNGKRTYVKLRDTSTCNLGVVVHEIGHIVGFMHEHQRPDRDAFVTINSNCVPAGSNAYGIISADVLKVGSYDINSTMHYRSTTLNAPNCNGTSRSESAIYKKDGTLLTHDWTTLSAGDVKATSAIYCRDGATSATSCDPGFAKTCSNNAWSACACVPGTTRACSSPDCCGTCGHAVQTCTASHTWSTGTCQNGC